MYAFKAKSKCVVEIAMPVLLSVLCPRRVQDKQSSFQIGRTLAAVARSELGYDQPPFFFAIFNERIGFSFEEIEVFICGASVGFLSLIHI